MTRLEHCWYTRCPWLVLLTPFSLVYALLVFLRRQAYRTGLLPGVRLPVPVVVVGNLAVGGTGKTPLVGWLARRLQEAGFRPGIVARGYRGRARHWPQQVRPDSDPAMVGDEAVMLAGICGCPMAVGPARAEAARALLANSDCDLILSDDGLQHYALHRDIEIAVVDGVRRLGNGFCLPAGPLREPPGRLETVDLRVVNGLGDHHEYAMRMRVTHACRLGNEDDRRPLAAFRGQRVHAVAGIGNPARFFEALRAADIRVEAHAFPDHHAFAAADFDFAESLPVLMTAKDAVKCGGLGLENAWVVPVTIHMHEDFLARVLGLLGDPASRPRPAHPAPGGTADGAEHG